MRPGISSDNSLELFHKAWKSYLGLKKAAAPFTHSFNKYLLDANLVSDTVLSTGDTDKNLCPYKLYSY